MGIFNSNDMNTANSLIDSINGAKVKRVRKENGLMERSEVEEKVILAEDNRQVLFG